MSHLKFLVHFFATISDVFVNLSSLTCVVFLSPAYLLNLNSFVLSGLSAHGVECVGGVACKRGTADCGEGSYFNNRPKETFSNKRRGHARILSTHPSARVSGRSRCVMKGGAIDVRGEWPYKKGQEDT